MGEEEYHGVVCGEGNSGNRTARHNQGRRVNSCTFLAL